MKTLRSLSISLIALVSATAISLPSCAQANDDLKVAIFLYDGMELLDFAGPAEVFASAGFNTYSVTIDGGTVECNRTGALLNKITPDYSLANSPSPDIVLFPGGGTGKISKDTVVLKWLKDVAKNGTFLMSVCTGASVLANTGLLEGMNITTWHGYIPALQSEHPEIKVLENTRYVDNGIFITTAGVSAGIDGALHLVSRVKGLDVAKSVARYMEYDKWQPGQGRIDKQNDFIDGVRTKKWRQSEFAEQFPKAKEVPFEGELKNLALELSEADRIEEAIAVLEICVRVYPKSATAHSMLGKLYKKVGRPAPESEEYYVELVKAGRYDDARKRLERDKKDFPGWQAFTHGGLLTKEGVHQFHSGNFSKSLDAFRLVALADPCFGSFYNVGEVSLKTGGKKEAIEAYRKSLQYQPENQEVIKILAELERQGN